jgi:hypothetical protein
MLTQSHTPFNSLLYFFIHENSTGYDWNELLPGRVANLFGCVVPSPSINDGYYSFLSRYPYFINVHIFFSHTTALFINEDYNFFSVAYFNVQDKIKENKHTYTLMYSKDDAGGKDDQFVTTSFEYEHPKPSMVSPTGMIYLISSTSRCDVYFSCELGCNCLVVAAS